jgi:hypothetical protein
MKNFAVLDNDIVVNTIVADTKEVAEQITNATCIEYDKTNLAGIGYKFNGTTFTEPEVTND